MPFPDSLYVHPRLLERIEAHALAHPEEEVCGLIGAIGRNPVSRYPVTNVADHRARGFEMDSRELIDAFKAMRRAGERLFAIYHSHPRGDATPSHEDLDRIGYPDVFQLIVSLRDDGTTVRGWRFAGDPPRPVEVDLRTRGNFRGS